jgi:transketolase
VETAIAWLAAVQRDKGPSCLVLSRQALTPFERSAEQIEEVKYGGYVLRDAAVVDVVLIGTGSEVEIAIHAAQILAGQGIGARVVSMPCVELFLSQDADYREAVLPTAVPRVSVEAGVTWFWRGMVGEGGGCVGIDSFGESGQADALYEHFALTPSTVADRAESLVRRKSGR